MADGICVEILKVTYILLAVMSMNHAVLAAFFISFSSVG